MNSFRLVQSTEGYCGKGTQECTFLLLHQVPIWAHTVLVLALSWPVHMLPSPLAGGQAAHSPGKAILRRHFRLEICNRGSRIRDCFSLEDILGSVGNRTRSIQVFVSNTMTRRAWAHLQIPSNSWGLTGAQGPGHLPLAPVARGSPSGWSRRGRR